MSVFCLLVRVDFQRLCAGKSRLAENRCEDAIILHYNTEVNSQSIKWALSGLTLMKLSRWWFFFWGKSPPLEICHVAAAHVWLIDRRYPALTNEMRVCWFSVIEKELILFVCDFPNVYNYYLSRHQQESWKETKPSWNESLKAGAMDSSLTVTHIKAWDKGLTSNVSAAVVDYINALSQTKREYEQLKQHWNLLRPEIWQHVLHSLCTYVILE